jgi:hypothetical protein
MTRGSKRNIIEWSGNLSVGTSSYGQVASIDIQYLDVALDQFFLGQDQVTSDEPN